MQRINADYVMTHFGCKTLALSEIEHRYNYAKDQCSDPGHCCFIRLALSTGVNEILQLKRIGLSILYYVFHRKYEKNNT